LGSPNPPKGNQVKHLLILILSFLLLSSPLFGQSEEMKEEEGEDDE